MRALARFLCSRKRRKDCYALQRSDAARVRNMTGLAAGKLPRNLKICFKTAEDKAFPGKRSFNIEYVWKSSYLLTLSPRTLLCHCVSSDAFLRTSLRKCFELIHVQNLTALAFGCDVGFCV